MPVTRGKQKGSRKRRETGRKKRIKNAQPDVPDSRDWMYEPALIKLPPSRDVPDDLHVLDQGFEGACTGFSLAAAINLLNRRRGTDETVSARMLYEMAKCHTRLKLRGLQVFNLRDELERDDDVLEVYRKSLLYLVSNAFERQRHRPLLGMERYVSEVTTARGMPVFRYSNGTSGNFTRSRDHVDFDNDPFTMNHILRTILGKKPEQPFTQEDLTY